MRNLTRSLNPRHGLVVGGVVLWGLMEFVALQRSQLRSRGRRLRQPAQLPRQRQA